MFKKCCNSDSVQHYSGNILKIIFHLSRLPAVYPLFYKTANLIFETYDFPKQVSKPAKWRNLNLTIGVRKIKMRKWENTNWKNAYFDPSNNQKDNLSEVNTPWIILTKSNWLSKLNTLETIPRRRTVLNESYKLPCWIKIQISSYTNQNRNMYI